MLNMFKTDGVESLHKELLKNYIDEKKIQTLIDSGVNINRRDAKGRTLLFEKLYYQKLLKKWMV